MAHDRPNDPSALEAQDAAATEVAESPKDLPAVDATALPAPVSEHPGDESPGDDPSAETGVQAPSLADLRTGMQLAGKVVNVTSLGAFVDVGVDRDGLVHSSEIRKAGRDGKINVGDEIQVWVANVDRRANRLGLSLEQKTSLRHISPGMVLNGRVMRVTKFGAFVDVGAVIDGLIHADEIRRENQQGKLEPGQELQVFVRNVNRKNRRLSLGLGQKTPLDSIRVGEELSGRVTRLTDFGAFVDIGAAVDGLVHVSELPQAGAPADFLSVGEETSVRVQSVDLRRRRISLSMRGVRQATAPSETQETEHFPTAMEIALREAQERTRQKKRGRRLS
jgi:small subunit ribosomal protein S1